GFAGLSSLLGVYAESIYSLKDGNEVLPQKLLEASNSEVRLETKVNAVEKTSNGSFRVSDTKNSSVFDAVIIATPLEVADITFEGVSIQGRQRRDYQRIYIQLMKGVVKPSYFNFDSSELPSIILTSKEVDPITRFSIRGSTRGESWVTVTSTQPIGDSVCDELFKNGTIVLDHTWNAAYPCFKPVEKIPDAFLDNGLVYLNVMESAASSLESSAFAALTAVKKLKQQKGS
ncbi:MAG: FAD-dependent oxidoreductase, partial [Candidatus Bathyarchaeota archaeon]|nr:FAD-dependent oxidoreductase [Candidatus Bathyarchaeota archaeon]